MRESRTGCLVIGSPRSGTTLCAAMVGSHPDVGMHSEDTSHGADKILGVKVWGNKLCIPNQIQLEPWSLSRSLHKRIEDGIRAFLGRPRYHRTYPSRINDVTIRTYVENGARLVAMLRDPDHVIDSMSRRGNLTEGQARTRWAHAIRITHQVRKEYSNRVCLVRFEDLVQEPTSVMNRICTFLNLPFAEQMIDGYAETPQYSYDGVDASRATRDVPSYDVGSVDAEAAALYDDLVATAVPTSDNIVS